MCATLQAVRTNLKLLALMGGLALSSAACRRDPPPSPEYAQAFERYLALRQDGRDAAFLTPEMDAVLQQLAAVDPKSRDAAAARELATTIEEGRSRARAHQDALAAARGVGRRPIDLPASSGEQEPEAEAAPAEADPVEKTPQPAYGMTVAELRQQFSRCFVPGEPMHIPNKGLRDIWVLKDLAICRQLHPKYVAEVVLLEGGKVWGTATPGARIEFPADAAAAGTGAESKPAGQAAPKIAADAAPQGPTGR